MILILLIIYILSVASILDELYSIAIRDNKFIFVYFDYQLGRAKTRVYELKEGLIPDMVNNEKVSYLNFFS
jgi:hypothetical protein